MDRLALSASVFPQNCTLVKASWFVFVIFEVGCCCALQPREQAANVDPADRALLVFAAVVFGSSRLPAPPTLPVEKIRQLCFFPGTAGSLSHTTTDSSIADDVPGPSKPKATSLSKRKKGKTADQAKDTMRQRQLVVSHSVLMGLSQNVINLAMDDDDEVGGTSVPVADDALAPAALMRLPAKMLVERYFLLILNSLGSVMQTSTDVNQKCRALRCLEVSCSLKNNVLRIVLFSVLYEYICNRHASAETGTISSQSPRRCGASNIGAPEASVK